MLYTAKKYVHIMTPYLIIGYEMVQALTYAAKRGVEVELTCPIFRINGTRFRWRVLIMKNFSVREFISMSIHRALSMPNLMCPTMKRRWSVRSIWITAACICILKSATLFFNNPAVEDVERDFQRTRAESQRMTVEDYKNLPWYERLTGRVLRLIAPLM